jgi:protein-S-isoprenylcysteine O-methyltransferase Ste14
MHSDLLPDGQSVLARRAVINGAMLFAIMAAVMFGGGGTLAWWQGWVFLLVYCAWATGASVWMYRHDPALFARRLRGGPAAEKEPAQKIIMSVMSAAYIGLIFIPALDYRYGWSRAPPWLVPVGHALFSLGWIMILFVLKENSFTASTVEVMPGQAVVSSGAYAIIRHPMYAGAIFLLAGIPLALGSWWGLAPMVAIAPGVIWRLLDEERMLARDLAGYAVYTERVRYRLVPGVW